MQSDNLCNSNLTPPLAPSSRLIPAVGGTGYRVMRLLSRGLILTFKKSV